MNDVVDMSRFIEAKSDQLNADDLIGTSKTIKITRVTGNDGDQPVSIFYEGDNGKPFKPCKTIRRVLMGVWGKYANEYVGKSMTIYRDDAVTFGGLATGGIRISHMSHLDKETVVVVMKSKGKKAGVTIKPLVVQDAAPKTSTPESWVADHLGFVNGAASIERLDAVIEAGKKAMTKLADGQPALHAQVTAAYAARRAELEGDGPSEADRGESHTGAADDLIARIEAADTDGLQKITDDWFADGKAIIEEADHARVEQAMDARAAVLKGQGA